MPQQNAARHGGVQRFHRARHGDAHGHAGSRYGLRRKARTLVADRDCAAARKIRSVDARRAPVKHGGVQDLSLIHIFTGCWTGSVLLNR